MKSANLRKILGHTYEKVTKKLRKTYEHKIGVVSHCVNVNNDVSLRNVWQKDKVINESLHLSDRMDDKVFQMIHSRKLALFLTFFLRTSYS